MTVLKPSKLKARTFAILNQARLKPVYVEHNGTLLVITKAELVLPREDHPLLSPLKLRAKAIESFYHPSKAW